MVVWSCEQGIIRGRLAGTIKEGLFMVELEFVVLWKFAAGYSRGISRTLTWDMFRCIDCMWGQCITAFRSCSIQMDWARTNRNHLAVVGSAVDLVELHTFLLYSVHAKVNKSKNENSTALFRTEVSVFVELTHLEAERTKASATQPLHLPFLFSLDLDIQIEFIQVPKPE